MGNLCCDPDHVEKRPDGGGSGVICAPEGGAGGCDWMEGTKGP